MGDVLHHAGRKGRQKRVGTGICAGLAVVMSSIASAQAQDGSVVLPGIDVTASRLGGGVVGTATTVITAADIARAPERTLQDILATVPGVQVRNLYGSVDGARDTVDLRGFGAAATSNTLVLVNGRRLNDIDLTGVDFAAIPRDSIERIEIIRGNSGAVLYGDGAVGGVINIITRNAASQPNSVSTIAAVGSYGYLSNATAARYAKGPWSVAAYGTLIGSNGYRQNNRLNEQNGVGDLRYTTDRGSAYLTISGDNQSVGLPGGRRVTLTSSELETARRGAATPFDYADTQGVNVTTGVTRRLGDDAELIVDAGMRRKLQQAEFFTAAHTAYSYVDSALTTWSVTPRLKLDHDLFGVPGHALIGVDAYWSDYGSDRSQAVNLRPIHRYDLTQTTLAVYGQDSLAVRPDTDLSFGARLQRNAVTAGDVYDATAPGAFDAQGLPLDTSETQYAYHLGLEHRLNDVFAVFARTGRAFRLPNVDERVGMSPFATPTTFDLKTQTSQDYEAGMRLSWAGVMVQASAWLMNLENELHYSPATFTNVNLDPTRRTGVELTASWRASDTVQLRGGLAYTRARFRDGRYAGNDIPLVSRWTGSAGVTWTIWQQWLVLDADLRYFGDRRMDNDQANVQPLIPGTAVVDVQLSGQVERLRWSVGVQNLFDADYYNYAIASASTIGTYNAYPLPGRTVLLKAGITF